VWVEGIKYPIHADARYWFRFSELIKNKHLLTVNDLSLFDYLYVFKIPENKLAGFTALQAFYRNEQPLPRESGKKSTGGPAIDWMLDSEYIWAAFLHQYHLDLIITNIHWHSFLALFNGLTGTKINESMSARVSDEKYMKDAREAWEIRDEVELAPVAVRIKNLDRPRPWAHKE
jgi:hypothetical protein